MNLRSTLLCSFILLLCTCVSALMKGVKEKGSKGLVFATFILFTLTPLFLSAQSEIDWTININTDQIVQTDKRIFTSLEKDIFTFLNGSTWTDDKFELEERIEATMFLTIAEVFEESNGTSTPVPNVYKGTLAIQSQRPIFGTSERTPVLNTQDKSINFSYQQGEGIIYSEQSYASDLGHILAFYCYMIVGLDYDTFSPQGGQPYFDLAQELYNRLPSEISNTQGWKSGSKTRNRYYLMENILSPRMLPLRRGYYNYHRKGLDMMTTDPVAARNNITLAIEDAQKANQAYPSSVYVQAFVDAKREEIIEIYKGATGVEQNTVISAMSRIDPSKSGDYRKIRYSGSTRRPSVGRAPVSRNTRGRQ